MTALRTAVGECGVTWASGCVEGVVEWQHGGQQSGVWSDLGFRKC